MGYIKTKIEEDKTFDKLKGKSLGCPSNILFWNDQQKHMERRIEKLNQEEDNENKNQNHTLLWGIMELVIYLSNILFWKEKKKQNQNHTLLMGDYGTGELCTGKAIIFYWNLSTGKTLILEASLKTLSQRENTKVFFINALGMTLLCFLWV